MSGNYEPYGTTPLPVDRDGNIVQKIVYNPNESNTWEVAQQPKSQQIAVYNGVKIDVCMHGASLLDVNQHFVIYAVKKGLIRILHRHSTLRTLFRGHEGQQVTDIRFFLDGDVLGSVGTAAPAASSTAAERYASSCVIIWRVFERTPEIMSEKLLEIKTSSLVIGRMIWHPFNPNQFWILHHKNHNATNASTNDDDHPNNGTIKRSATLVETTKITTVPHPTENHALCEFFSDDVIMEGAIQIDGDDKNVASSVMYTGNLTDLDWSEKDARHVLTTHDDSCTIRLWDLKQLTTSINSAPNSSTVQPECLFAMHEDQPVSRCKFLPHEYAKNTNNSSNSTTSAALTNCFLTATNNNSMITLWSPFYEHQQMPVKLQIFGLQNPSSSYLLDICYGSGSSDNAPPSAFILLADQTEGKLFAWHLQSEWANQSTVSTTTPAESSAVNNHASTLALVGCDYVVPFDTCYPMYSWSTKVAPAADVSEEELTDNAASIFDIKLFAYQSVVIQSLTLTSFMCVPPESSFNDSTAGILVEKQQENVGNDALLSVVVPEITTVNIGTTSDVDDFDEEDYDVGDDDDNDEDEGDEDDSDDQNSDYNAAPEASSLPTPDAFGGSPIALSSKVAATAGGPFDKNAFSNWLGAIATKSSNQQFEAPENNIDFLSPLGVGAAADVGSGSNNDVNTVQPVPSYPPLSMPPAPPAPVGAGNPGNNLISDLLSAPAAKIPLASRQQKHPQQELPKSKSPVNEYSLNRGNALDAKKKKKNSRKVASSPKHINNGGQYALASRNGGKKTAPITILKREAGPVFPVQQLSSHLKNENTAAETIQAPSCPSPMGVLSQVISDAPLETANVDSANRETIPNKDIERTLNKVLKNHFAKHEEAFTSNIRTVLKEEIDGKIDGIETTIISKVDKLFQQNSEKALQEVIFKMDKLIKRVDGKIDVDNVLLSRTVAESIKEPLRTSFAENMRSIFIPAVEAVTGQMFVQISDSLEKGLALGTKTAIQQATEAIAITNNNNNLAKDAAHKNELAHLSSQISSMVGMMQNLTSEVESLRATVITTQSQMMTMRGLLPHDGGIPGGGVGESIAPPGLGGQRSCIGPPVISPPVDPLIVIQEEICLLLNQRQYEAAFNKALSTSNVQLAIYCCAHADLEDVMGGVGSPKLSQAILLCLMHQLASNLCTSTSNNVGDYHTELSWLQEIAVSLNPTDSTIERHFPGVLHQLNVGINQRLSQCDPSLRRPLQRLLQVIRGI